MGIVEQEGSESSRDYQRTNNCRIPCRDQYPTRGNILGYFPRPIREGENPMDDQGCQTLEKGSNCSLLAVG